jgi:two-component system, NtrC family, response regulator HydG
VARILVVDDEAGLRDSLRRALSRQGHSVDEASAVDEALRKLDATAFDLLLTDIRLKDRSGLEIVTFARQKRPDTRIVVMTAFGSVNVAVDAMRVGADDFLEKPFRMDAVMNRLDRALESVRLARQVERLERENEILRDAIETLPVDARLVGASAGMSRVRDLIDRVAVAEASVLIRGETGTGKEMVARAIHRLSRRAGRPFVACDCSAFAEGVLESELFGHEKGAFTGADRRRLGRFELADTGTLFLDEIGDLATAIQVKLLRVLQERTFARVGGTETVAVDVRILAATNQDLEAAMRGKTFREDLYYRLNVVTIHVPPLRERRDDIPALVDLFVARYGRRSEGGVVQVAPEALTALQAYSWPGNVRQLENVVHRATVLCRDEIIRFEDVSLELGERGGASPLTTDLRATLNAVEQGLLERAVREHHGNLTAAGRALGIERNLLRYKLRKHGLR